VRELPRQLSADELAELFEGRSRFVERLAGLPDPLDAAFDLVGELPEDDLVEALEAHPQIERVTFCLFSAPALDAFRAAMAR